jgi:hypothetical protein
MQAMELEQTTQPFVPVDDKRPKLEEPPPVRLVAVDDCVLTAAAGLEPELNEFYVGLLGFEREAGGPPIVYHAENQSLRIGIVETPDPRENLRSLGICVPSLAELVRRLNEEEIEFVRQRGLMPGNERILLADPAGHPLEITEYRLII